MPDYTLARQITPRMINSNGQTVSPFSFATQTQSWIGADRWEMDVALPPMNRKQAAPWIAWLAATQGSLNVFQLGDPLGLRPQGNVRGTPVVNGAQAATVNQLATRGWLPNAVGLLMPCDYIQVGWRLHMVMSPTVITADASGNATIPIWPGLREAVVDAQPINFLNASGLFRLASDTREWSLNETRLWGISFKAVEAR
jgi:hypothetical protein